MTCRKAVKELPAYLAGELPERARSRLEAHLKHCALCTAEMRALEQTDHLLDTLERIEPKRDLVGAVVQHIEREQETTPAFKRFLTSLRERQPQLQYAAAIVLLVAALGLMIYRSYSPPTVAIVPPPLPISPTAMYPAEAERPGEPMASDLTGGWDFWIPLDENGVKQLNEELRRARSGQAQPSPAEPPPTDIVPVEAVITIEPGPDGSLVIRPGREGTAPVADAPGESPSGD